MTIFGILLATVFAFGLVGRRVAPAGISGPMVFVGVGLGAVLLGVSVGVLEVPIASGGVGGEIGLAFLEVALALTLFSDAARMDPRRLRRGSVLPARLLGIGMPLTIVLGAALALLLLPELDFWECVVLATVLAPTDAALGQAVVSNRLVPERIREALEAEAGLNDGLSVPILYLALALAVNEEGVTGFSFVTFTAEQIGLGALVGALAGLVIGRLLDWSRSRGWLERGLEGAAFAAAGVGTWLLAGEVGGNGFIAAFVAGLMLHFAPTGADPEAEEFSGEAGTLLDLTAFFIFGLVAWDLLSVVGPRHVVYAVLSLSVIRMLPVAAALSGTGLRSASTAFVGWFGPRGLASIVLAITVLEEQPELAGLEDVLVTAAVTVLLSILLHGLTAPPLAQRYAEYIRYHGTGAELGPDSAGDSASSGQTAPVGDHVGENGSASAGGGETH